MPSNFDTVLELIEGYGSELSDEEIQVVDNLSEKGINFAIDNFGCESLYIKYMEILRIFILKIDTELVLVNDGQLGYDKTIKALVLLATLLDITLVAEGIESPMQLIRLEECGVSNIQGFYFAKPYPLSRMDVQTITKNYQ
ncbi:TPA: EAL domain-containing protein [Citrobacter braakii]|nr:EAL domain-containing protein [Citrobacter braakii]